MDDKKPSIFVGKPGKHPAKKDCRDIDLGKFIDIKKMGKIPMKHDSTFKKTTPWGMMNNWLLSDCTCAAAGHMIECWTANAYTETLIADDAVNIVKKNIEELLYYFTEVNFL